MERTWLKEALFAGQTSAGYKLGTVLFQGWFWARPSGCCLLYRGAGMDCVDFGDVLAVVNADAGEITAPDYAPHDSGETYFYVLRRANCFGRIERTLSAAAKVAIDSDGALAGDRPNSVFELGVERTGDGGIRLMWWYSPIDQTARPVCFKVFGDGGTGQVDYDNALAVIGYEGQRFYSFESDALGAGRYLFAVRGEEAGGVGDGSAVQVGVGLVGEAAEGIEILDVRAL